MLHNDRDREAGYLAKGHQTCPDEWSVVDGYAASSMRCEALTSSMARWGSSQEEARVANLVMLRFFACALPRLLGPSAEARVHLVPLLLVCAAHEQVEE